jgi:hypothetical protein
MKLSARRDDPPLSCIHGQVVGLSVALADNLWKLPTGPLP